MNDKDPALLFFRESLDKYIANEITPYYEQWEQDNIFPRKVWNQLGEQGFLAVDIDEAYGGFGSTYEYSAQIIEAFGKANLSALWSSLCVHSDIVAHYLLNQGSEEQKQRYLPKMVSGECVGAIAMTEPGAGSDLQGIRSRAIPDGDGFILNGSKTFITNGQHCDMVIVAAKTDPNASGAKGLSLFLVDADSKGFQRGRNLEKIGLHSGDTSELFFEDVRLDKNALLGELNQGFIILMNELQRERLTLAVGCVAAAEGVIEETVTYVKERQAFGKPLAHMQNTKFSMAKMATDYQVNRAFLDQCTQRFMQGDLDVANVSMAKLASSEMLARVVDGCLQLYGGYGYMSEYSISRAYADARIQRIYGGTSEIMKELISRSVLK